MNKEEFKKEINAKRKDGGKYGQWYFFTGTVEGKEIRLKGFQTWLQIYDVDGIHYGGNMDITVKRFNEVLLSPFTD